MRRIGIRTWLHAIAAPHSLARLKVKKAITSPSRVLMLGFGALILLGALLLHLPLASTGERLPFLDAIIDCGLIAPEPSTIIDLTSDVPRLIRLGKGSVDAIPDIVVDEPGA